jgi:hypothetical protein
MSIPRLFKRRQILLVGGAGVTGLLGGGTITAGFINGHFVSRPQPAQGAPTSLAQPAKGPQEQSDEPYLNPGTYNQQFLAKTADVRQIWDFATINQVQSDGGFAPIKNAMNAFQFVYKKNLYAVICLRGSAVVYALDDAMWAKYSLSTIYGPQSGGFTDRNPLYQRLTTDNGTLGFQNPNSLYQDYSLQALLQRGSHIAACHDALNGLSGQLAQQGHTAQVIFKELAAHLVPGAQQTPSGSSLIAVAQHLGFTYATQ